MASTFVKVSNNGLSSTLKCELLFTHNKYETDFHHIPSYHIIINIKYACAEGGPSAGTPLGLSEFC